MQSDSISDSVSLDASRTEAAAAEGLWGDLNAEKTETVLQPSLTFCTLLSCLSWLRLSELAISGVLSVKPLLHCLYRQVSGSW